jgi:hypothetical protein
MTITPIPSFTLSYTFFKKKTGGVLIVGSNNMTGKGLVGNYEISLMHELNFKNNPDAELVASAERTVEKYCDIAGGFSHPLDDKFLQELESAGYLGSEQGGTNKPETSGEADITVTAAPRKKLFASRTVPQPVARRAAAAKGIVHPPKLAVAAAPAAATPAPAAPAAAAKRGPILWKKKLAPSDVQSQTGHPTGVVRLTQAKWRVGTKLIDWTT